VDLHTEAIFSCSLGIQAAAHPFHPLLDAFRGDPLGHASVATTQRYTRVEIADLKRVLKRCHPRERHQIEAHDQD